MEPREREFLLLIEGFISQTGRGPSNDEITSLLQMGPNYICRFLKDMESRGWIERQNSGGRGIKRVISLTDQGQEVVGRVRALECAEC